MAAPSRVADVFSLQRSAGNRAVAQLVARRLAVQRRRYPRVTAQGTLLQVKHADVYKDLERFGELLDVAVTIGWQQATQEPTNAGYAALDGYLNRWAQQWAEYSNSATSTRTKSEIRPLVPAMCGYAIESLATKVFLQDRVSWVGENSGTKFDVVMQDPHGSTRPDVVLKSGGQEYAWYDITADTPTSQNHIDKKVGAGWQNRPYVAEIRYPKVDADVVEQASQAWVSSGSPPIAGIDPKMIANYWVERARFEVLMGALKRDLAPLLERARTAAGHVDTTRRQYVRGLLALVSKGTDLSALSDVPKMKGAIADVDSDDMPTPKEAAAIVTYVTDTAHMGWGFRKSSKDYGFVSSFSTPVRLPLGVAWLQEAAANRGIAVSDAAAFDHIKANYSEGLNALKAAGLA